MQTKKLKEVVISKKWKKPKITIGEYKIWYLPYILIAQMEWKDVVEYTNENCPKCDKNDILMVWDWSIWKIATNLEWVIWSTIVKLTPNWIEKEYLYYFLQFSKPIILANPKWTWLAHINSDIFWNLEVPIFSLEQQHLIVSEIEKQFSRLDEWLLSLRRAKENLKKYKASVLKSAVEWKLTEIFRKTQKLESASILLEKILEERKKKFLSENPGKKYKEPEAIKQDDLPNIELPEGWEWCNLDLTSLSWWNWFWKRRGESWLDTVVLRLADITNYKIDYTNLRKINMTLDEINKYKLNEKDLLFIRVNWTKDLCWKPILIQNLDNECICFCDHFIRLTLSKNINSSFINYIFLSSKYRKKIEEKIVCTAWQNTISQLSLKFIPIPLPPLSEQKEIVKIVESKLSVVEKLEKLVDENIKRSENLKQSILKKAFEGELVREE